MTQDDMKDGPAQNTRAVTGSNAGAALKAFVERIERLEEEKKSYTDDIRDVYAEAKAHGYDTKQLRRVIRERRKDDAERREENAVFDTYCSALGIEW